MDWRYDPSLMLYLPLYELDGASFMSRDPRGHLCTVTNATWGSQGRALVGNGFISVPHNVVFNLSTFTIMAWIKDSNATQGNTKILSKRELDGSTASLQFGSLDATQWDIWWTVGDVAKTKLWVADTSDGSWHHVAVTRNADFALEFFLDGVSLGSQVGDSGTIDFITESLTVGCSRWSGAQQGFWNGSIGEIIVYNRALSAIEVINNYLATKWRYQG